MHQRHRQEVQEREREIWRRRIQGDTQERIATSLNVSQQAVSLALRRIEKRLAGEFVAEVAQIKARQAAQLEHVYAEAMAAWERSCQDAERRQVVTGRAKATELGLIRLPDLETTTIEGQSGNPALLAQAMAALADIRKIYGYDAPQRREHSGPDGFPIAMQPVIREVVVELPSRPGELPENC